MELWVSAVFYTGAHRCGVDGVTDVIVGANMFPDVDDGVADVTVGVDSIVSDVKCHSVGVDG